MIQTLFGTIGKDTFNTKHWGIKAYYEKGVFQDKNIWSLPQLEEVLNRDKAYIDESVRVSTNYSRANQTGENKWVHSKNELREALEKGQGITVNRLDRLLPYSHPLMSLYQLLAEQTGCAEADLQIASFFTLADSQNFDWHIDRDHVFTMQVEGHKTWEVIQDDTLHSWTLKPGDILYVPYGMRHRVLANTDSLSIAFIARPLCYRDLLLEVVMNRLNMSTSDLLSAIVPLPLGWLNDNSLHGLDSIIEDTELFAQISPHEWDTAVQELRLQTVPNLYNKQTSNLLGGLSTQPVSLETVVNKANKFEWKFTNNYEHVCVFSEGVDTVVGPSSLIPALEYISSKEGLIPVAALPDIYEDKTKLLIVSRFVKAGVLNVASETR
ncbi:TPA: cupin domain-containing protein [Vibrio diabolicus]